MERGGALRGRLGAVHADGGHLGDLDKSEWINLTGASGHVYSPHYTDQTEKWVKGELLPWAFTDKAVKKATQETLVLKP
ncbi:hypothetical protein Sdia_60250 [Streptomyces diastaticus subsp. diastaticus]|uniref:Penicillin acylase family protein n=1 Tax=Streptomyces diastaticus subsp. diastaticus TaxID=68040 RepID=A0ABQ1CY65_STRDI|nr:hypothetical protein Sdia_60250 [Streptomyces diastaticus subsp. diastaticus]